MSCLKGDIDAHDWAEMSQIFAESAWDNKATLALNSAVTWAAGITLQGTMSLRHIGCTPEASGTLTISSQSVSSSLRARVVLVLVLVDDAGQSVISGRWV